ncbi:MAG: leucyl/phenylalanyl-tRNA--protein transferase [Saprospiraceae bacterium]
MPVFYLSERSLAFPHPELANEDGVLAIGGDLSPERLLVAYENGIFPWFNPNDPILWWSPDPRFVLYPDKLKVAKSMRPYFNQNKYQVTYDTHFRDVISACQQTRRKRGGGGTWITDEMLEAYCKLHELGYAHSVEVWQGEELVGGLYGISLGKCFFGESMFMKAANASKFGFISLVRQLQQLDYWLIDCQQHTDHLASLGAEDMERMEFLKILKRNAQEVTMVGKWTDIFGNI